MSWPEQGERLPRGWWEAGRRRPPGALLTRRAQAATFRAVIRSFKSKALRVFVETEEGRRLSVPNARRVRQILLSLDAAKRPDEMNTPGLRFHALKGDRRGTF